MGSTSDVFRLERDILKNGPVDLLFVEAAVNDGGKGRPESEILRSMEGMVRHMRNNDPTTDIIFMYFVDPSKIEDYNQGKTPDIIRYHDSIARYYNIPALNLAKEVTDRINAGEFTWKDDFKNLHPSPFGQGVYARSMIVFMENAWSGNVADDDKILDYPIPPKLDKNCYDNGILILAKEVKVVKGWIYNENWIPEMKAGTRSNYTHVPMLVGNYPGKVLKLSFKGNAVGIIPAVGPDAGIIEYRIDKGVWKKKDLFTKYSSRLYLPWPYMLADDLESGKHTLQLIISKDKNPKSVGNLCVLRYFFVNKVK